MSVDGVAHINPHFVRTVKYMQNRKTKPDYRVSSAPTFQEVASTDKIAPSSVMTEYSEVDIPVDYLDRKEFTCPEFAAQEVEHMWKRVWQFAGREEQIAEEGDLLVYNGPVASIIIVRTADGSIKGYYNSCLHRGMKLCTRDTSVMKLACPFHGFTWNLNGELEHVPARWDFPHLQAETMNLPEVKVDVWGGFIFINHDENCAPLQQYLGHLVPHFKDASYDNHELTTVIRRPIHANWKTCMDLLMEVYHIAALHPQALAFAGDSSSQYDVWADDPHVSRFINPAAVQSDQFPYPLTQQEILDVMARANGEGNAARVPEGATARHVLAETSRTYMAAQYGRDFSNVPDCEVNDGTHYSLFPNMILFRALIFPYVYRFLPIAGQPDQCMWEIFIMSPKGDDVAEPQIIELANSDSFLSSNALSNIFAEILDQDVVGMEQSQEGMKHGGDRPLILSKYQEVRIRHLHHSLHRYLAGEL